MIHYNNHNQNHNQNLHNYSKDSQYKYNNTVHSKVSMISRTRLLVSQLTNCFGLFQNHRQPLHTPLVRSPHPGSTQNTLALKLVFLGIWNQKYLV